jgi:ribonuclease P protein component
VVSSKTASRAVDRNRIKRRARTIIRDLLSPTSRRVVVYYAKKPAVEASYATLATDMKDLFTRAFASSK